jgi:hypothetical protein
MHEKIGKLSTLKAFAESVVKISLLEFTESIMIEDDYLVPVFLCSIHDSRKQAEAGDSATRNPSIRNAARPG